MDTTPFGKLPAELRNDIWALVLQHDRPIEIERTAHGLHSRLSCECKRILAITATCRDIREETIELFYNLNTFQVSEELGDALLRMLHECIGDDAFSAIGKVQITSEHRAGDSYYQGMRFRGAFNRVSQIAQNHGQYIMCIEMRFILREWAFGLPGQTNDDAAKLEWTMTGDPTSWPALDNDLTRRIYELEYPYEDRNQIGICIESLMTAVEEWKIVRDQMLGKDWTMKERRLL